MRTRSIAWVLAGLTCGCASLTLTPAGKQVAIFNVPAGVSAEQSAMPQGCRRLSSFPRTWMSELDLEGQAHPFAKEQNASAAEGGNVLLVTKKIISPRTDPDCPNALPIRDCPGRSGARYDVVVESYTCTADALRVLNTPKSPGK